MRTALGKGLNALISEETLSDVARTTTPTAPPMVNTLPVDRIAPNPKQPRRHFDETSLNELSDSIRQKGVLQPIIVFALGGGKYEIIAGERRWRAAQRAGLTNIPAIVREGGEGDRFEVSIIENVQRKDLNPIEQAEGYRRLQDEFGLTQEKIAQVVGKDRAVVANTLRLLNLPELIRAAVIDEKITMGHARALLAIENLDEQQTLFTRIINEALPVRAVEQEAKAQKKRTPTTAATPTPPKASEIKTLEDELQHHLGRRVEFHTTGVGAQKGWIRLEFYSLDDLEILLGHLRKTAP